MKISCVIPYYKNKETIVNCVESIKDQDYDNWEIAIVLDGHTKDDWSFLTDHFMENKEDKIKLHCLDINAGAPSARNFGAKKTDGEILFFIDSDCQLYPGTFSICIEKFEEDPALSFVYGNYRYDKKDNFTSKPFNAQDLETFNYVNTMSPVKRSVFNKVDGFREGMKFFQDWDLFYRISKKLYYGVWINEFFFSTAHPKENNISGSQGKTLAEKATEFYKINNIKPKRLVVTTFSAPLQAKHRAEILGADYCGPEPDSPKHIRYPINLDLEQWKATFMVGLFNAPQQALNNHFAVMKGKKLVQFIGTDVWQLRNCHSFEDLKCIQEALRSEDIICFMNSQRMHEELNEINIESYLVYPPIYKLNKFKVTKRFPKKYTVAVYFSDTPNMNELEGKGNMSNIPIIIDVASAMPDIDFKFFGDVGRVWKDENGCVIKKKKNVEFCGKIPFDKMNEFINSCSCIIRSTQHDGFPQLPIQFMLAGRDSIVSVPDTQFIANIKLSFEEPTDYMAHKNEIINAIYELASKTRPTLEQTKITAEVKKEYYRDLCCEKRFKEEILGCL